MREFIGWSSEADGEPQFSVIYVPDLRYVDVSTSSSSKEARELSYRGQFSEFDESLGTLTSHLKKSQKWFETTVILVGLNGLPEANHREEPEQVNLYAENTHVGLLVKPARRIRDEVRNWTVDTNVSTADLAATLADIMKVKLPIDKGDPLRSLSLEPSLRHESLKEHSSRPLIVESGWPRAHWGGSERSALVDRNFLVLFEYPLSVFNTLIDRNQLLPLASEDIKRIEGMESWLETLTKAGYGPYTPPEALFLKAQRLLTRIWGFSDAGARQQLLEYILGETGKDRSITEATASSLALAFIDVEDWRSLQRLARATVREDWRYIADINLRVSRIRPPVSPHGNCLRQAIEVATGRTRDGARVCEASETTRLLLWVEKATHSDESEVQKDAFMRAYADFTQARKMARLNYKYGLPWDVSPTILGAPKELDLVLALPEYKPFRQTARRKFASESVEKTKN